MRAGATKARAARTPSEHGVQVRRVSELSLRPSVRGDEVLLGTNRSRIEFVEPHARVRAARLAERRASRPIKPLAIENP